MQLFPYLELNNSIHIEEMSLFRNIFYQIKTSVKSTFYNSSKAEANSWGFDQKNYANTEKLVVLRFTQ